MIREICDHCGNLVDDQIDTPPQTIDGKHGPFILSVRIGGAVVCGACRVAAVVGARDGLATRHAPPRSKVTKPRAKRAAAK